VHFDSVTAWWTAFATALSSPFLTTSAGPGLSPNESSPADTGDWRQAISQAGFGMAVVAPGKRLLLAVNDAFAAMHGYDPAEMVGKSLDEFTVAGSGRPLTMPSDSSPGAVQEVFETVHIRKDGTTFACVTDMTQSHGGTEADSRRVEQDDKTPRAAYFSDVVGLNQIEASVRESEERFRSLAAALPQLIWSSTKEGLIEYVNPLWRTYAGWSADQAPPDDPWRALLHPEDQDAYLERWQASLRSGEVFETQARLKQMPDGSYRWFLCRAVPLRNSQGAIVRWFGSCTDIQEQMTGATKLQTAIDALSRSNSDLEQFAYAASHDLQEPLRMVAIYTQLLREEYADKLDSTAETYINLAVTGAQRMEALLKNLLSYATIANASGESAECVDANEALNTAQMNLQATIKETRASITADRLPVVWIPRFHLVRLFQNLISNAMKYRGNLDPVIHVSSQRTGPSWTFSVRDNGIGIAPEYLTQIFGVFRRLHGQRYEGTGIGLAMCQKIVERGGGKIWVDSQPGKGSTFFFTLPTIEERK
jgi:PAS domain S-box-containing protein